MLQPDPSEHAHNKAMVLNMRKHRTILYAILTDFARQLSMPGTILCGRVSCRVFLQRFFLYLARQSLILNSSYSTKTPCTKPVVEIHTAEPLSPISVGDYLYEVSFPDPLAVPRGHILQVATKQHFSISFAYTQVMK